MENAVDALYMGAAVLIFVIALTLSISSFDNVKNQIDGIITTDEKINYALEKKEFINFIKANEDVRTVGVDSIISTIRRKGNEGYNVYIVLKKGSITGLTNKQVLINGEMKTAMKISGDVTQKLDDEIMKKIYRDINGKSFKEYLGIYKNESVTSDENKETHRTITYIEI